MKLEHLIKKSVSDLTEEELEDRIHNLKKYKIYTKKKMLSNSDKQLNDLLKSLTKEQLKILIQHLQDEQKIK